jgi:hypothetical protein
MKKSIDLQAKISIIGGSDKEDEMGRIYAEMGVYDP